MAAVGNDYPLLLDLIPNLGELIFEANASRGDYDIVKSKEKFKFLLQRFLHAICQPEHPIIICLDDIQWIDPASVNLLEIIMNDAGLSRSLLIVCTVREEEVPESHPVSKLWQRIKDRRQQSPRTLTIQNLSLETLEAFVADLLNLDPQQVRELANIAHTRTDGNIFFFVQFLTALRDGGLLRYDIASMKWVWDESEIRRSTVVATNVLTVLMNKLSQLPTDAKALLKVAACLGSTFEEDLVDLVMTNLEPTGLLSVEAYGERTSSQVIQFLLGEGILEDIARTSSRSRCYCYCHNQIGFAAHELLDDEGLPRLQLAIGRILLEHKSEIDYQSLLFTIVDLWNEGEELVTGSKQTRILVNLNFEAGKKALETFAFGASAHYLQHAIDHIPEHKRWDEEYELSLELYNCLIKVEYSNGTWDPLRQHAREVIGQKNRPMMDKIEAYMALIMVLITQEHNHLGAIQLAVHVLKLLGVPFSPKAGKLAVAGGLIKTKRLLSKVPLESLLTQTEMTDKVKHTALDVLSTVNSAMYASNPELLMCSVLKTLRWSLKYGISKDTAKCVSFYGLVEMALGNASYGAKACKLAVELAEKNNLMDTEYSPTSAVYGFVLPWTTPLHTCSNKLLAGYNAGLETGDLHYGFMNITLFCFFSYCSGKPFEALEADMREYARQMKEYNQVLQLQFLSLTWQTVLNLMGQCDGNPDVLSGEVMDYEEMIQMADKDKIPPLRAQVQCYRLQLAVFYNNFDLAAKVIGPASMISVVNPANPIIWRNGLFEGITAFELVRRGKKKWKSTAVKALSKTQKWVEAGNVNCVHILYLLQAEKAAMENNFDEARQLFDKAIVTSARNGFRGDRALATERCAIMYDILGDDFWFNDYHEKAKEAYQEMEAFGKVEQMNDALTRKETNRPCFEIDVVDDSLMMGTMENKSTAFSDLMTLPTRETGVSSEDRKWFPAAQVP